MFLIVVWSVKLRKSYLILLILAVFDILVCAVLILFAISSWSQKWIFGDLGCDISYGVLYVCYYFISFTIIFTFTSHLFFRSIKWYVSASVSALLLAAAVLVYLFQGSLSIFVEIFWGNDTLCTVKLDMLLEATYLLKILDLYVPAVLLIVYLLCKFLEKMSGKIFLKSSGTFDSFAFMIVINALYWIFRILFAQYELLVLEILQCFVQIYRPFLYAFLCDDLRNSFKSIVTGNNIKEPSRFDPFNIAITKVDENIWLRCSMNTTNDQHILFRITLQLWP